jgi:excisionase family DNA binding protein
MDTPTTARDESPTRPGWWTVKETAGYLKEHEVTVRNRIRRGQLRAAKLGRVWRVRGPQWPDEMLESLVPREVKR